MELGCLDLGCIEKQISQKTSSVVAENSDSDPNPNPNPNPNDDSKPSKNKVLKEGNQSSPRTLFRLTAQIKKPPRRKTSPLSWFPRKKVDSYLKRKLKLLQEVDGMNSTLDETLGDTKTHVSKVLKEKIAVREAAQKAIEARKDALVEASWSRILKAARIETKEAEDNLVKAEKAATEAFDSAKEIGVIMYDIQDCPRKKHCKIETSAVNPGESESTTHTVATSFDTAFEVDKQVATAVKSAFVRLSTSASIGKQEFKLLLKKISEHPDLDENYQDICESTSECESDVDSKSCRNERENLVDMMLQRLRCLHEEELASLSTIVATCGLNVALVEAENGGRTQQDVHEELPGLDKFLVKRLTRLEREIKDSKSTKIKEILDKENKISEEAKVAMVPDLGSMLIKHTSKLEKEIEESKRKCGNEYEPKCKKSDRLKQEMKDNGPGLDEVFVKRVSRLERDVQEAKKEKENIDLNKKKKKNPLPSWNNNVDGVESLDKVLVKHVSRLEKEKMATREMKEDVIVKRKDIILNLEHGEESLDQILVKHKSRLEREKVAAVATVEEHIEVETNPLIAKRAARERELQEAWGGVSLGNSIRSRVSKLQRDKAAWIKAEEEERRVAAEPKVVVKGD